MDIYPSWENSWWKGMEGAGWVWREAQHSLLNMCECPDYLCNTQMQRNTNISQKQLRCTKREETREDSWKPAWFPVSTQSTCLASSQGNPTCILVTLKQSPSGNEGWCFLERQWFSQSALMRWPDCFELELLLCPKISKFRDIFLTQNTTTTI